MKIKSFFTLIISLCTMVSCSTDDSFSTSLAHRLQFSTDTLGMDTVFSNVPTSTRTFWVYNRSDKGVRIKNVRLEGGNQNGFRVNVDGTFLGSAAGFQMSDLELHKKDSLKVFVELTSPVNSSPQPQLLEDRLLFTLENGTQQKVVLRAHTWNALSYNNVHIKADSVISSTSPIIIYGGIRVDSMATLTVVAGTTLYFHANAGIEVYGRLLLKGSANANVVLRGDRLDRLFSYLPYDRVSGQWKGIHLHSSSYDNEFRYADIHGTFDGVVADSSDVSRTKLTLDASVIHNCQGYGLAANNSNITVRNTEISNTQADCVRINGGKATFNHCTLAQFYPFDSNRGAALNISAAMFALDAFLCTNTLITGYANDVLLDNKGDKALAFNYHFGHCIIRTPKVTTADSVRFSHVVFENIADTVSMGTKHFIKVDNKKQQYDFRLSQSSAAINKGDAANTFLTDRRGKTRDAQPDIGAYEF